MKIKLLLLIALLMLLTKCEKAPIYEGRFNSPEDTSRYILAIQSVELLKYPYYSNSWVPDAEELQDVYLIYGDVYASNPVLQSNLGQMQEDMPETVIPYKFVLDEPFIDTLVFIDEPHSFYLHKLFVYDYDASLLVPDPYNDFNDELVYLYAPVKFKEGNNLIISESESAIVEFSLTKIP